ncbi:MAG TPA: response regulator [Acidimicrobiales bacterium]|nr:response regulator [Acidimicrobiales bacterium]
MQILVVDDSPVMRKIVRRTLRQAGFGGHDVVEAGDGVEALAALEEDDFDVVMSDWNMPNMSGIELLEEVREKGNQVTFGFVTSESTALMRARATSFGASFFITKPFTAETFEDALADTLD